jgi:hypothetical protein
VAADDGVGLVYEGRERVDVVSWRSGAAGWAVTRGADGEVSEERLEARTL